MACVSDEDSDWQPPGDLGEEAEDLVRVRMFRSFDYQSGHNARVGELINRNI